MLAISHNFNLEGASLSMFELFSGLHAQQSLQTIVMGFSEGPLRELYLEQDFEVLDPPFPLSWLRDDKAVHQAMDTLTQWMKASAVDAVYANTLLGYPAILAAHRAGIPSFWNIRESQDLNFWQNYLGARIQLMLDALSLATKCIFVAVATHDLWQSIVPGLSGEVIPNGFDAEAFALRQTNLSRSDWRRQQDIPNDAMVFLCVGTLHERKGQLDLIRAVTELQDMMKPVVAVCLGDAGGQYSEEVHALIDSLPDSVQQQIRVLPRVNSPGDAYRAADVYVCCSRNESYPRVILEAMASGLPIITSGVFGIREQVMFGGNALEYHPCDWEELAQNMKFFCDNPGLLETMGAASRQRLEQLPDYSKMLAGYNKVIRDTLASW